MIIFGLRNKRLDIIEDRATRCPRCSGGPMAHNIFKSYMHIWYIPIFPAGKKVMSKCMNCGSEIDERELPATAIAQAKMSSMKRTPVWMYSGLIIIAVVAIGASIGAAKDRKKEKSQLNNPEPGDVYLMEAENGFAYFRVEEITEDSIYLNPHSAWFPKESQATFTWGEYEGRDKWIAYSLSDFDKEKKRVRDITRTYTTQQDEDLLENPDAEYEVTEDGSGNSPAPSPEPDAPAYENENHNDNAKPSAAPGR